MLEDRGAKISRFGLVWPFAALVLAGAALVTTQDAPLVSSRPETPASYETPEPPSSAGIRSTHAQLWEDPLVSASRADCQLQSADQVQNQLASILKLDPSRFVIMPVLTYGGPYASDKEDRMRNRYAVLSALGTSGFKLSYPQRMSASVVPIITDFGATGRLVVNKVQVPIKLFSRDVAQAPKTDEPHKEGLAGKGASGEVDAGVDYVLVLWINESQLGQKPLMALAQIIKQLFPGDWEETKKPRLAAIGPVDSGTLLSMIKEDASWGSEAADKELDENGRQALKCDEKLASWFPSNGSDACDPIQQERCWDLAIKSWLTDLRKENHFKRFARPELYSPRATVSFEALGLTPTTQFRNCGLGIVQAIGPDASLFQVLAEELRLRGALPESQQSKEHIVLVTERDTLYGRSVPKTFGKVLKVGAEQNLHVFTYLRGIDGEVPSKDHASASVGSNDREALARLELPEGTSQRDYLRRLAEEIVRRDAHLRRYGRGRVAAVGVVGSDVFDKLLVLRALRYQFPTARFFTTDLDARYSTPAEYAFTRNLIVVSHFGLGLNRSLRYDVAPFRDSYQTSTFFATLRALDSRHLRALLEGQAYDIPWGPPGARNLVLRVPDQDVLTPLTEDMGFMEPLVFEVGRTGPYQLTAPASPVAARIQPVSSRSGPWWTWPFYSVLALAALIAFVGCLTYYFAALQRMVGSLRDSAIRLNHWVLRLFGRRATDLRPTRADWWLCAGLAITVLLYVLLLVDNSRLEGEPLSVLEGVSIWPSVILLYIAVLWAIYLVCSWLRISGENLKVLEHDYFGETDEAVTGLVSPNQLLHECKRTEQSRMRLQRVSLQSLAFFVFTLALFAVTGSFPGIPSRGWIAHIFGLLITNLALLALFVVSFFVLDVMRNSSRFIVDLAKGKYDLTRGELGKQRRIPSDTWRRELSELLTIQLVARHTRLPGRLLVYPFLLALLLAAARLSFFDSWDVSFTLLSVISAILLGVVVGGFLLRKNAERARRNVLRRLRDQLSDALGDSRQAARVDRLRNVIANVENEQRGAFRPLSEDPVIAAAFIPFGGTGTLVLLEQLLNYI
jgi:hypothetical protein